jgi:hypothetical protein
LESNLKDKQTIVGKLIDLVNKYRGQLKKQRKQNKSSVKSRGELLKTLGKPFNVTLFKVADKESKRKMLEM